ncbi:MAG: hypothetical protein H0U36_11490 [Nocardioidaceae bacterium]|nr:hypothetical protein [Nocardioidaceae bacterium]
MRPSAQHWGTTRAEREATYPCERYATRPYRRYLRAVDVDADLAVLFRWVCQVKVAPYSYDWIDNGGRQSPRQLTPGAEKLAVGQAFIVGTIVEFETGCHITAVGTPKAARIFGPITLTYQVREQGTGSRLTVALTVSASSLPGRVRRELLGWGDLVMMRKQLLTLKACAEASELAKGA